MLVGVVFGVNGVVGSLLGPTLTSSSLYVKSPFGQGSAEVDGYLFFIGQILKLGPDLTHIFAIGYVWKGYT